MDPTNHKIEVHCVLDMHLAYESFFQIEIHFQVRYFAP